MFKKPFTLVCGWLFCVAQAANAFVLLGPGDAEGNAAKAWQSRGANGGWNIGYALPGDIGAPLDPIEAYRWNVPTLTYAFDASFIDFFGTNGIRAIEEAFQILNDLPNVNQMSADLREFPLSTLRQNYEATQFGLIDIKSTALNLILEELGLAQADRRVWALHQRRALTGPNNPAVYDVIQYNIDPVTLLRSSYVNETLYTYLIQQFPPPGAFTPYADAYEFTVPPEAVPNPPVTSLQAFVAGSFFTGLTRDDVGGLRYLLNPKRVVAETLLPGTIIGAASATSPFIGTNFLGTNAVPGGGGGATNLGTAALRGGVGKLHFRRVNFDGVLGGTFTAITNAYKDRVIAGNTGRFVELPVLRPITAPDFIFTVADLNQTYLTRTTTASWINNDALTPAGTLGGPGIINPTITITYNLIHPIFQNQAPDFLGEGTLGISSGSWATFDGTTNPPVIYPQYLHLSIGDLRNAAQQGGF